MRPRQFADLLLEWVSGDQQVRARSFADAGYPGVPFGVELWLPTRARIYLQAVGAAPPGRHSPTSPEPVTGPVLPQAPPIRLPAEGPTTLTLVERWLAWRITTGSCPQIAAVELFQDRPRAGGVPYGLTVVFHSGARVWVYFRHITPPGRTPGAGPVFRSLPTV